MVLKDLRKGIEYCLSNGKRLYDDAKFLQNDERFRTAVPIYILAYEEFGKAVYLYGKLSDGVEVTEAEFRSLTRVGSHATKITMDYTEVEDRLNKMTDFEFENTKAWAERKGQRFWTVDRKTAIALNRASMNVLEKLNVVKKAFLYVGYVKGAWYIQTKFSDRMLDYLCKYLIVDVIRPYHMIQLDMYMYSLGAKKGERMTNELEGKMLASEHRKNLNDLFIIYQTSSFRKTVRNAYMVIDACHVGYND
jgi:AbiV family abortive infection protein